MTDTNTQTTENNEPKSAVQLLIEKRERLAVQANQFIAKIQRIDAEIIAVQRVGELAEGSAVKVRLGRAETTRVVDAVIVGIKETDGEKQFKVQHGEGFDAEVAVVRTSQLVFNSEEPTEAAE